MNNFNYMVLILTIYIVFCKAEVVDLTWTFNNDTVVWPGVTHFHFTKKIANTERGFWYAMNEFCVGEHGGTHFDSPYHFDKNGWTVDQVPPERLVAKGVMIDIREESLKLGQDARLKVEHLTKWEKDYGPFENGSVLLIDFGRSQFWNTNKTKYMGLDETNKLLSPGISDEAAQWLAESGKFYGVGLDAISVDPGNSTTMQVHRIFAKTQMYNLENVNLSRKLPARNFTLIIAPMKIGEGTGGPVRILALLGQD